MLIHTLPLDLIVMRHFIKLICFLTLASCTTTIYIEVKNDHTVSVRGLFDIPLLTHSDSMQFNSYYKTDLVSNLFIDKDGLINFTLKNIDSLGNYISPVFNKGYFKFKLQDDQLTIIDGHGKAFVGNDHSCCDIYLELCFEQNIKIVQTEDKVKTATANHLIITKWRRDFRKNRRKINMTIELKNN